jgi:hypothetical protein
MSNDFDKELLCQRWIRDHKASNETEETYIPQGFKPVRGLKGFELKPDQTAIDISSGSADQPEERTGNWEIEEGDLPILQISLDNGKTKKLSIISVEKDRLLVRKENL